MVRVAAFVLLLLVGTSARADDSQVPDLRWIQLSDQVLPAGGIADRKGDAWVAHGSLAGVAYRFSSDSRFLSVSSQSGVDWQALDLDTSWLVSCHVLLPSEERRCSTIRAVPADPSGQKVAGIEFKNDAVCVVSEVITRNIEIKIDDAAPLHLQRADYCLRGEQGEQFKRDVLAGRSVTIKGYFARPEPVVELTLSTYGLQQAFTLRDWISDQYKAKRLQPAAPQ
jgi:hypothetical protein